MKVIINNLIVPLNTDQNRFLLSLVEKLGISSKDILNIEYLKRSIDSRKKADIKLVYNIEVELRAGTVVPNIPQIVIQKDENKIERVPIYSKKSAIAVIGTGPAGLFAAYRLAQLGYTPLVFEQGEKVEDRDRSVDRFVKSNILNPYSNIQFGEGGAGTYSDGKLNTRIKSGYINEVFDLLVKCGAQKEILWDYKPHIGTDVLKEVVKNIRELIIEMGGKFFFSHRMVDFNISDGKINEITTVNSLGEEEKIPVEFLILATGHSSRDIYRLLHKKNVAMENKPFAVGARIEHTREFIDKAMYGKSAGSSQLGSATYSLTYNNRDENRGVFSFCMCPGGVIVNAASEEGGTLVNGMSYSDRMREYSNSALVVAVKENEFGEELFSGMEFQERIEKEAYRIAGYGGLYQNTEDFLKNRKSSKINGSSYEMPLTSFDLNQLYPDFITENMKNAMEHWNKIHSGFVGKNANLIGPETRTSAPVKVVRGINGESVSVKGLYPIGEGAGYAGGITSAAVDGFKIVDLAFSIEK